MDNTKHSFYVTYGQETSQIVMNPTCLLTDYHTMFLLLFPCRKDPCSNISLQPWSPCPMTASFLNSATPSYTTRLNGGTGIILYQTASSYLFLANTLLEPKEMPDVFQMRLSTLGEQNIRNTFLILRYTHFCRGVDSTSCRKRSTGMLAPCGLQCFPQLCHVGWMSFGWWTVLDTHGKLLSVKNPSALQFLTHNPVRLAPTTIPPVQRQLSLLSCPFTP